MRCISVLLCVLKGFCFFLCLPLLVPVQDHITVALYYFSVSHDSSLIFMEVKPSMSLYIFFLFCFAVVALVVVSLLLLLIIFLKIHTGIDLK